MRNRRSGNNSSSSIFSIIPHIMIFIAIIYGYLYIKQNNLYPMYADQIYLGTKILIALVILFGSVRSFMFPILTMLAGGYDLYLIQVQQSYIVSMHDAVQLIVASVVGLIISFVVRL